MGLTIEVYGGSWRTFMEASVEVHGVPWNSTDKKMDPVD